MENVVGVPVAPRPHRGGGRGESFCVFAKTV
jgi:hypothetical protein